MTPSAIVVRCVHRSSPTRQHSIGGAVNPELDSVISDDTALTCRPDCEVAWPSRTQIISQTAHSGGCQGRLASAIDGLLARASALLNVHGSLKTHLFIFAAALILPLLVVVGIALSSIVNSDVAATRQQLIRTAGDISGGVDREVLGYLTVLKTLATSPDLEDGDLRSFHARAKAALRDRPADVLLLDKSFQQLVNTRVPFGTQLPKTCG